MLDTIPVAVPHSHRAEELTGFCALDAACSSQREAWLELWNAWPTREVLAHPAYVQLFAGPGERALCLAARTPAGAILFPLIQRPLGTLPWAAAHHNACDLTSPYGYGGPYAWGGAVRYADAFWDQVDRWAQSQNAVTLFTRRPLFEDQTLPFRGPERPWLWNVVRSLEPPLADIWQDYAHKVRTNVRRAQRLGLRVEFDAHGEHLQEFQCVYEETMRRRGADAHYYFPPEFFATLCDTLRGQFLFCHVLDGRRIVSTELLLLSAQHIYSFLGGTRTESLCQRPNELLKHAVVQWGVQCGLRSYVLGGGYRPGDSIFRYKRAFAPRQLVMFRVGQRILDPQSHVQLVQQRQRWESQANPDWRPRPHFFPEYRG